MSKEENYKIPKPNDAVHHPSHYQSKSGLEVIDVIRAFTEELNGTEAYYTGNILKYMCRWKKKNGLEDLRKAKQYLDWLIEETENDHKGQEKPFGCIDPFNYARMMNMGPASLSPGSGCIRDYACSETDTVKESKENEK